MVLSCISLACFKPILSIFASGHPDRPKTKKGAKFAPFNSSVDVLTTLA